MNAEQVKRHLIPAYERELEAARKKGDASAIEAIERELAFARKQAGFPETALKTAAERRRKTGRPN